MRNAQHEDYEFPTNRHNLSLEEYKAKINNNKCSCK